MFHHMLDKPKVSELEIAVHGDKDILGFEVSEDKVSSVQVLEGCNHLSSIKGSQLNIEFFKMVDNSHQVSTRHKINVHVHASLVLRDTSHWQDEGVIKLVHEFNLVEQMVLLFILYQLELALNLDCEFSFVAFDGSSFHCFGLFGVCFNVLIGLLEFWFVDMCPPFHW